MIIHELRLDMIPNMSKNEVWVNQYDTDFLIRITLFASKGTFSVETGTTAAIRGTKPDGNGYSADASVNGNVITVTGHEQMTVVAGKSIYELTLYKDGKELSSVNFNLRVERAALDKDTPTSRSQTRELVDIEDHADEIIAAVDNMGQYAGDSEAYAKGTRGGVAVPSTDPAYQNNAKYWAEHASGENLAPQFSTSTAYAAGDYVLYNNHLYRFTSAHAAGAWTGSDASAVTTMGEVSDLKDDLSELDGLDDRIKEALLACFQHMPWLDNNSFVLLNTLKRALYKITVPSDYQEVEYIESSGTQYIDTGILSSIPMKAEVVARGSAVATPFVGAGVSGVENSRFFFFGLFATKVASRFSNDNNGNVSGTWLSPEYTINTGDVFSAVSKIEQNGNTYIEVNGHSTSRTRKTPTVGYPIKVMIQPNTGTCVPIRIYTLALYKGDEKVFDGIPCYKKSNGEGGLYDVVTNTFFGNSGTGEFILGEDI